MTETINVEKHSEETLHKTLTTEAKQSEKISNQDGGARGAMVIIIGNGYCATSSNPRPD